MNNHRPPSEPSWRSTARTGAAPVRDDWPPNGQGPILAHQGTEWHRLPSRLLGRSVRLAGHRPAADPPVAADARGPSPQTCQLTPTTADGGRK